MSVHHSRHIARAFGAVLKQARTGAGLSQETLAERAELDRTTPSLYERGLRQPTLGTLLGLARALHLDPPVLVQRLVAQLRGEAP
jgi:transcriptional regulator with XRE-family HTH domain